MKIKILSMILLLALSSVSCKKFLAAKTDKQLVIPATIQDAQTLLDNYTAMNTFYPNIGAMGDDDLYLLDAYYNTLTTINANNYSWAKEAVNDQDWTFMYANIVDANLALETVQAIEPTGNNIADWKRVKGSALFFRAWAFFHLAQYYAEPYDKATSGTKPGIPLRLSSDVNAPNVRAGMQETYQRIITDFKDAAQLLPAVNLPVSRPSKASAYGALARLFLIMEDYEQAGKYADSSLQLNSGLLNYNSLDPAAASPFTRFNSEDLFHSAIVIVAALTASNYRVDTTLYQSYGANDLRKTLFFKTNGTGALTYYTYKGSYDGNASAIVFNGLAVDEMYLIRAECSARQGSTAAAINDLNTVLITRWKTGTFVPFTATSADDALIKILTERRKELIGRGQRWFDLRRLNRDTRFAKTLTRKINGQLLQLPPNDTRYTFLIPQAVITLTGMQQNTR